MQLLLEQNPRRWYGNPVRRRRRRNPGAAWHEKSQGDVSSFPGMTRYDKGWNDGYKTAHKLSRDEAIKLGMPNPRGRRSRTMRNPRAMSIPLVGQFMPKGIKAVDMIAAAGGLALVSFLPGMLVKTPVTMGQKWLKIGVAFGSALIAGYAANTIAKGSAQSAVLGGLAGVGLQIVESISPGLVPVRGRVPVGRRIGAAQTVSMPFSRSSERVGILQP